MLAYRMKSLFRSPFRTIFDEARLLPEIRRSIAMMVMGNIFGNLFGVISTGSALTGFARDLGANDLIFGVLSGIPLAASLMQIPAAILVSRTQKRKRYMLTFGIISRAVWLLIGLVPYVIVVDTGLIRLWSVIFLVGLSAANGSFINVSFTPWMADLIPISIRGRWMSVRDGLNAVGSVMIGLVTAYILDHMPGYAGYAFVFILGGTLGVLDMCCFIFVKEVHHSAPVRTNLLKVSRQIFADGPFFRFMIFWTVWCFTANLSAPYLIRYALGEMGLSYIQVTLSGQIAAALTTVLVITFWGRSLDRYGSKPVLWIACTLSSVAQGSYLFSVYGSVLPTLLHNVIGSAFWCATNLAATNRLLSSSPDDQRPSYVAFFSSFASLLGSFLGVLAGGALLELLQSMIDRQNLGTGFFADRYKMIIALSIVARLLVVLLFIPSLDNEKGYTIKQVLRDLGQRMLPAHRSGRF